MYAQRFRAPLLLLLLLATALSPPYLGWPWSVDAWIASGIVEWPPQTQHYVLLAIGVGIVLVDRAFRTRFPLRYRLSNIRLLSAPATLFAVAAVIFWILRVQHWEGDFAGYHGHTAVDSPEFLVPVMEPAEPLGTITLAYTCQVARWLGTSCATGVQVESVLYGASAIVAMALWARRFPQPQAVFWMVALSGYTVLFCGYVEKGTIKALALNMWYVYAGTRAVTETAPRWRHISSVLLALATLMHGSGLVWLPAHAAFVWRRPGWRGRAGSVACWLVPFVAVALLFFTGLTPRKGGQMGNTLAFLSWTSDLCHTYWHAGLCDQPFFSVEHGFWFVNSLLTFAPVATLCIPGAFLRRPSDRLTLWLTLGACGWLFLSAIWHPGMGYGWITDWDIFAMPPYVVTVWAVTVASAQLDAMDLRHFAALWITMTLPHTWLWWRRWQGVHL